jgi:hypothetical protein
VSHMFNKSLLSLALGLGISQMSPMAFAADGEPLLLAAANGAQGTTADTTLYRARWSLPSCGILKPAAPPVSESKSDSDDDLPTPASVEAAAKRSKKVAKQNTDSPAQSTSAAAPLQ